MGDIVRAGLISVPNKNFFSFLGTHMFLLCCSNDSFQMKWF